jgi:hypothetical protein
VKNLYYKKIDVRTFYRYKKRLQIAENQLFKSLKYLNTAFGGAKGFDV